MILEMSLRKDTSSTSSVNPAHITAEQMDTTAAEIPDRPVADVTSDTGQQSDGTYVSIAAIEIIVALPEATINCSDGKLPRQYCQAKQSVEFTLTFNYLRWQGLPGVRSGFKPCLGKMIVLEQYRP